jgi:hypothetical protein
MFHLEHMNPIHHEIFRRLTNNLLLGVLSYYYKRHSNLPSCYIGEAGRVTPVAPQGISVSLNLAQIFLTDMTMQQSIEKEPLRLTNAPKVQ